jgi:hypothetical protein
MPRATVRTILALALAGGALVDIVAPGNAFGANAPLVVAAFLGAAFVVAGRDGLRRMDPADAWLAPAAVALAGMTALRTDGWLVLVDLWFAMLLAFGAVGTLAGGRITRNAVPRVLDVSIGLFAVTVGGAMAVLAALVQRPAAGAPAPFPAEAEIDDGIGAGAAAADTGPRAMVRPRLARLRPALPVLRGLLVALPIVVVFAVLFASADAVFARLAGTVLAWQPDVDLADLAARSVVVSVVAWTWAGLLAFSAGQLPGLVTPMRALDADPSDTMSAPSTGGAAQAPVRRAAVEAATVIVVLDLLFAAFVVLQVAYLFGGRDTLSAGGLTYADYARRGFFELVAVAVLAIALVVVLDLAVGRRTRTQLAASVALLGLTAVVLVSAFVRLRLYQDAYGWTELRFVVAVAIGWLAAALAIVAGLLLARRAAWTLHALGILLLVVIGGTNVVGPQAYVAQRNLERAVNPALVPAGGRTGLDLDYLATLGDEAVPAVVAAIDRLPDPADRDWLARFLASRAAELREWPAVLGWPAWNLSRERAREALAAWEARRTDALRR